jgi:hypothetical protein
MKDSFHKQLSSHLGIHWYDRILSWKGFENITKEKATGIVVGFVAFVVLVGVLFSHYRQGSLEKLEQAEVLTSKLSCKTEDRLSPEVYEKDSKELCSLAQDDSLVLKRYSGIAAEEEVLRSVDPLTKKFFEESIETLQNSDASLYAAFVNATLLSEKKQYDEALLVIEPLLAKSEEFPVLHSFLFIQKIAILKKSNKPIDDVVSELKEYCSTRPKLVPLLETFSILK